VAVLDGGLGKWGAEERPLEDLPPVPRNRHFTARLNSTLVRDLDHVRRLLKTNSEQVLDARSQGRFEGTAPEPREGLPSGHMPGSLNLPFVDILDTGQKTMLPAEELHQAFTEAGVDLHKPVTTTCGSGVTAALLALGLHLLGHRQVAVYDGSWSEWASRDDTPIEP
jgi:thiosulfate/3-mercaptopyruvate sulfurtransferase